MVNINHFKYYKTSPEIIKLAVMYYVRFPLSLRQVEDLQHYLWRAIDHEGTILDCYVSKRRDRKVARKVLKKLMSKYGRPQQIVTDKLPSYKGIKYAACTRK